MHKALTATSIGSACVLTAALALLNGPATAGAASPVEPGRFVWRDLMTRDMAAAQRFYGELLGWRFEAAPRRNLPYVLARVDRTLVAGIIDVSSVPDAGPQWVSFMAVANVDETAMLVRAQGGRILVEPRDLPVARAAIVADPQGAPLGVAELKRNAPDPAQPVARHFFWQEYLAKDASQALAFYTKLAGYTTSVSESRLGVDYHVLRKTRGHAGLFQLPATLADVQPNWLPYVLVDDPAALAARVTTLGGRVLVPASPERRNGSVVLVADPGGAPLALQKYPF
jgi:predicted enzyme related to lactoylglutathione lyase